MPPDDDLGLEGQAPEGTKTPAAPPTGLTADQLQEALAPVTTGIASLNTRLGTLETNSKPADPVEPEAPTAPNADEAAALAERLLIDTDGVLTEYQEKAVEAASKQIGEQFTTSLTPLFNDLREDKLADAEAAQDGIYGKGFFEKEIRSRLTNEEKTGVLDQYPVNHQARSDILEASVQALIGQKMKTAEGRKELRELEAAQDKRRETMDPGGQLGEGAPTRRAARLSPQAKETLEHILANTKHGVTAAILNETEEERPRDIDEWLALDRNKKAASA